jgi:hypothetical protein
MFHMGGFFLLRHQFTTQVLRDFLDALKPVDGILGHLPLRNLSYVLRH